MSKLNLAKLAQNEITKDEAKRTKGGFPCRCYCICECMAEARIDYRFSLLDAEHFSIDFALN